MDRRELKRRIVESGLFDPKYYGSRYPDVAAAGLLNAKADALDHYILIGSRLGRIPHQALAAEDLPPAAWETALEELPIAKLIAEHDLTFDHTWYRERYKDVVKAGIEPLEHYRKSGRYERRSPNRKADLIKNLDAVWYASRYAHLIGSDRTAFRHFLSKGSLQGIQPNNGQQMANSLFRRFSPSEYSSQTSFVIEADTITPITEGFNLSIAVHMHIFYDSLLEEMSGNVSNITCPYDVFISVPEDVYDIDDIFARARRDLKGCRNLVVRAFKNVGRDIAPMLAGFGPELLQYDLLLHIHSKQSLHNPGQSAWRRYLLHHACGNQNIVNQIINHFATTPETGGVFPPYFGKLRDQPSWGQNLKTIALLCDRLGVAQVDPEDVPDFPAGSFFWVRSMAIAPLLDHSFAYDDFDAELGQKDKTVAHAVERLVGHVPKALGYSIAMPFVDVAFDLRHYYPQNRASPVWASKRIDIDAIVSARASRPKRRTAMVTAVTGGFEPLIIHESLSDDIDYICFTNDPLLDGYGLYDICVVSYDHPDMRRVARFVKTNLIHLLPDYDTIIWIDGNLQLTAPINTLISTMKDRGFSIAAIPHPVRSSVQEEAEAAIRANLDDPDIIRAQIEKYARIDPDLARERLIESNFMIFDMTDPRVRKATDLWWSEIQAHSKRDQLSLNFALRAHDVAWMPILEEQFSMRDGPFSRMFSHGAGPRYAPTGNGGLRVVSASVRKGQEVGHASIPDVADLEALKSACGDTRAELERITELTDPFAFVPSDTTAASENPEDMQTDRLLNGVSLQNWVPRRWMQQEWTASVGLTKLHDAACFGGTISKTFVDGYENGQMVLSQDGTLCDASYGVWNGERLLPRNMLTAIGDDRWRLETGISPQTLMGDHYLLGSLQPHFGHTLLEGLSRAWAMLEHPDLFSKMPLLVFESRLLEFQKRFLELAGIAEDRIVHVPINGVTVERLWIADPSLRSHRWISARQGRVWGRISDAISITTPTRKIYLSRSLISERPLSNEAEVESILERQGFEIIHPETLPLDEQIRIAAQAAHIVGPVGSQMYLAAFQKSGTKKTVLAPSNFYAKDDLLISRAIGNQCQVVFGEKIDNFAERAERRWSLDRTERLFSLTD